MFLNHYSFTFARYPSEFLDEVQIQAQHDDQPRSCEAQTGRLDKGFK